MPVHVHRPIRFAVVKQRLLTKDGVIADWLSETRALRSTTRWIVYAMGAAKLGRLARISSTCNPQTSLGFRSFGCERRALKIGQRYVDEEHMVLDLADAG
jgi:hypothetical protein